ncbi:hypothetical protein ACTJKO_14895 [Curtobacterium sp. 22159]|uniref:hypothetical protein n=1 Tax=Curtobacterium sp. 22159 TaxID=3453882 RepID=UPI003F85D137
MTVDPSVPAHTPPRTPPRRGRATIAVLVGVVAFAVAVAAVAVLATVRSGSVGAWVAELQGKVSVARYDDGRSVPTSHRPDWFPEGARDVTVKMPGPTSGTDGIKLDAAVPSGTTLPTTCTASGYSQAWDGGGTWPTFGAGDIRACGDWRAVLRDDHLYLWR